MPGRSFRILPVPLIVGSLLAANAVLAVALARAALAPRAIRVVPSARAEEDLIAGSVPDAAAREFALRYVLHFDNFTPATVEAGHEVLRRMISPRTWSEASAALEKRKQVVLEGRMSSQVLPLSSRVDGRKVVVEALRRTFIADRLSRECKTAYSIILEPQPPTDPNPFGLAVVSQEIREEEALKDEK